MMGRAARSRRRRRNRGQKIHHGHWIARDIVVTAIAMNARGRRTRPNATALDTVRNHRTVALAMHAHRRRTGPNATAATTATTLPNRGGTVAALPTTDRGRTAVANTGRNQTAHYRLPQGSLGVLFQVGLPSGLHVLALLKGVHVSATDEPLTRRQPTWP